MSDRYSRQEALVPQDELIKNKILVIGVGAIGRQVALQLTSIGAPDICLVDHDTVEEVNIPTQGYFDSDIGKPKVIATLGLCSNINIKSNIYIQNNKFKKSAYHGQNVIFCCVDKIHTRKFIWDSLKDKIDFWVDGRMSAEVLRVISATKNDPKSIENYEDTLFSADEAFAGSCTAKSTIYCSNIAAGFMVARYAAWLRGIPLDHDVLINLLSNDLMVG